jgi:hypothetical protein
LGHAYQGLFHDAALYTLQALARLEPESLAHDPFLRFGSQDHFTIFSPLYAAAIRLWGIEPAAAVLTLLSQVALLGGAYALARSVSTPGVSTPGVATPGVATPGASTPALALLGTALFLAIPGYYGPDRIFTCMEAFLTPRMAAEALVLCSIAAALQQRPLPALLLTAAAILVHPLMAAAGIATLLWLYVGIPRPRRAFALLLAAAAALAGMAWVGPEGSPVGRFDAAWLALVRNRSPYLFLAHWTVDDWGRLAVTLATLAVGAGSLADARARRLCQAAALTTLSGVALTGLACDWLHLVLFTQLQPWRWQWFGTVAAALILPTLIAAGWTTHTARARTTGILLLAAWIFGANAYALAAAGAALAAFGLLQRLNAREARLVFLGACALAALAVVWRVATNLEFTDAYYVDPTLPLWMRKAMSFARDGSAGAAALGLAWWLSRTGRGRLAVPALIILGAAGAALLLALAPQVSRSWSAREFSPDSFAEFRRLIPPGAEVFWPENPLATWVVLGRANYLSVPQTSGLVFSRATALEMQRRAAALGEAIAPRTFLDWSTGGIHVVLSKQQLEKSCRTGEFPYLVSGAQLNLPSMALVRPAGGGTKRAIRLYACQTPAAAAAT